MLDSRVTAHAIELHVMDDAIHHKLKSFANFFGALVRGLDRFGAIYHHKDLMVSFQTGFPLSCDSSPSIKD